MSTSQKSHIFTPENVSRLWDFKKSHDWCSSLAFRSSSIQILFEFNLSLSLVSYLIFKQVLSKILRRSFQVSSFLAIVSNFFIPFHRSIWVPSSLDAHSLQFHITIQFRHRYCHKGSGDPNYIRLEFRPLLQCKNNCWKLFLYW